MKITLIKDVQDWMKDEITEVKDIKAIHELAMSAAFFECYNNATEFTKYESIDECIGQECLFQNGSLHGIVDDIIININGQDYFFSRCYITKSQHLILVAKPYIDDIDPDDCTKIWESDDIYFLVEGI